MEAVRVLEAEEAIARQISCPQRQTRSRLRTI
jgi:hypothetical protein